MAKAARAPTVKRKPQAPGPQTRLVKPKSKRARRILEAREPKLVRAAAGSMAVDLCVQLCSLRRSAVMHRTAQRSPSPVCFAA